MVYVPVKNLKYNVFNIVYKICFKMLIGEFFIAESRMFPFLESFLQKNSPFSINDDWRADKSKWLYFSSIYAYGY